MGCSQVDWVPEKEWMVSEPEKNTLLYFDTGNESFGKG
jgi:hypothetical protein